MLERSNDRDDCILLFGMPRSGTTWLGKLFDSHPHVLYRHEPDDFKRPRLSPGAGIADVESQRAELQAFVRSLPTVRESRVGGKRPVFAKAFMSRARYRLMQAGIEIARVGSRLYPRFPILFYANGENDSDRRIVWKSIQSLPRLGLILDALPGARAIHVVRHPCGFIASIQRGTEAGRFTHDGADRNVYELVRQVVGTPLGDELGFDNQFKAYLRSLTPEERLAWMWVVSNRKAARECEGNEHYLRVCYEQICREPLAGVERMFEFAGLDMDPQTRAFIAASTGETRDDYYSVFKNPEKAAWQWRDELAPEIVDRVMAIAAQSEIGAGYLRTSPLPHQLA